MAVKRRSGLGKGLDSLIRTKPRNPKNEDNSTSQDGSEERVAIDLAGSEADSNQRIESEKTEDGENSPVEASSVNTGTGENDQGSASENPDESAGNDNPANENEPSPDTDAGANEYLNKGESVVIMKISSVEPNREQPRKNFREEGIEELSSSIAQYGIIQPLLVQKKDDYYEIIAGERRWRAAMKAGLKEVPVIIKDYTNKEVVEISLIENIQREDLNPIEEALAYERLIREFEMTQDQVAGRVSKSRSAVTNSLRLLRLEGEVRQMVITGELSEGHARALLSITNEETQKLLAERIIKENLSVRETERLVRKLTKPEKARKEKQVDYQKEAILNNLSEQLKVILGTKVSIIEKGRSKGKIEIEFYSDDELNRLFEMLQNLNQPE